MRCGQFQIGHAVLVGATEPIFDIDLLDEDPEVGLAAGRIVLGDFRERFEAPLDLWSRADYRIHWRQALVRIVETGRPSALVTSMLDPTSANFVRWWLMYRFGEAVVFQEHLLFLDLLDEPFSLDDPFKSIPNYSNASDEGSVSEWRLPVDALAAKLQQACG